MLDIILARHGETEWNVVETFRGRADIDLTTRGIAQAKQLAKHLGSRQVTAVYSSPLKRALKTAAAVASYHNLTVTASPGLTDINYGDWQGLTPHAVEERYPELFALWRDRPDKVRIPGGESLRQVRTRSLGAVNDVVHRHSGAVVLVSHRAVLHVLICALLGLPASHFWNISLDLCGTTTFTYENGRLVLREHNNTSYLKAEI